MLTILIDLVCMYIHERCRIPMLWSSLLPSCETLRFLWPRKKKIMLKGWKSLNFKNTCNTNKIMYTLNFEIVAIYFAIRYFAWIRYLILVNCSIGLTKKTRNYECPKWLLTISFYCKVLSFCNNKISAWNLCTFSCELLRMVQWCYHRTLKKKGKSWDL